MKYLILATTLGLVFGQHQCVYTDSQGSGFTLNLTAISDWTMELETPDWFFYYTPCRNGFNCYQGSAQFHVNAAQMKQGANLCAHYLAVDHHESPNYAFNGGSWHFSYQDGELCDVTQQPRTLDVFYNCNEEMQTPAYFYNINEVRPCHYVMEIRGNIGCVPENSHNKNCQWRVSNGTGGYYYLDLSPLNNETIYAPLSHGYYHTITPCRNGVYCYQQYPYPVMGVIDNHVTGTCEHYGAIWEEGRVQPYLWGTGTNQQHWSFHYYNGQKCSNGALGEEELRFYCDPSVQTWKVINTTQSNCHFDINIATKYACIN